MILVVSAGVNGRWLS